MAKTETAKFNSEFLQVMQSRGFIHQCTDAPNLDKSLKNNRVMANIGCDATAPSLHAGSLVHILHLR